MTHGLGLTQELTRSAAPAGAWANLSPAAAEPPPRAVSARVHHGVSSNTCHSFLI
eukprot:CAMPEP_0174740506 /NCGR_PEP_ID=MMETSP1094-20130205/73759_1 /TAXON_ID=156173 /ORGANISM="Chrysochromulina brevifilum, Strain UTEX LB 985" /LENGTH=54 /DNA_ID=CAMNT_0015944219 /DNA_START=13 /DNA_END=174 /DNA_ORIENTATION=-